FRFSPRGLKRIVARLDLRTDFQSVFVILHRLILAAAELGRTVPKNRAAHPDQSWVVRRRRGRFLLQRQDAINSFFLARVVLWLNKEKKTVARNYSEFGVNELRSLFERAFEFVESGVEILLQLPWINCVIETVDRAPPLRKAAPVSDARRELLV